MNIDTGRIERVSEDLTSAEALRRRLVPVDLEHATEKQKAEMCVSLKDHSSALGKELTAWRSKYVPHQGAKQTAKATCSANKS